MSEMPWVRVIVEPASERQAGKPVWIHVQCNNPSAGESYKFHSGVTPIQLNKLH